MLKLSTRHHQSAFPLSPSPSIRSVTFFGEVFTPTRTSTTRVAVNNHGLPLCTAITAPVIVVIKNESNESHNKKKNNKKKKELRRRQPCISTATITYLAERCLHHITDAGSNCRHVTINLRSHRLNCPPYVPSPSPTKSSPPERDAQITVPLLRYRCMSHHRRAIPTSTSATRAVVNNHSLPLRTAITTLVIAAVASR
ncbi:hypothetical protein E2542_SST21435 [Spatholobus suberectus]|nr:hypothetical protein E2542_SST21435 [Spatholobus suberectus]